MEEVRPMRERRSIPEDPATTRNRPEAKHALRMGELRLWLDVLQTTRITQAPAWRNPLQGWFRGL
jgi:hypothetical protein